MSPDNLTPPCTQYDLENESESEMYTNMYLTDDEELLSGMGMISTQLHSKHPSLQSSPTRPCHWKRPLTKDCENENSIKIKPILPSSEFVKNELLRVGKHKESLGGGKLGKSQNQTRRATPVDRAFHRIDKNWCRSPSPRGRPSTPEMSSRLLRKFERRDTEIQHSDIDTTEFLIARLEKLNDQFSNDPKSVCMHRNGVKATLAVLESLTLPTTTPTSENILGLEEDLSNTDTESVESGKSPATPSLTESSDIDPDNLVDGDKSSSDETTVSGEQPGVVADWEFWTSLVEDYSIIAFKTPYLLTAKIRAGIPGRLRGILWQTMCQGRSTYLETMYNQLLLESSPYERIIMRDLPRTFPRLEMFKDENGIGQTRLFNVMKAYSIYDDGVGYCQGLGFLVGPLLMNMPECEAFCVFVRLMEDYDMRSMFTEKMEGLELRLYQLNSLLSSILPDLFHHFQTHGINTGMFASQWFLTLFAYSYPLPLVLRIFDIVFAEGAPETIMRISLALLKCNQEKLLNMEEFEDIIGFLSSHLFDTFTNSTELIQDAMSLSQVITKEKLDSLAQRYTSDNNIRSDRKQKKKGWGWVVKGLNVSQSPDTSHNSCGNLGNPNIPSAPTVSDPTSDTESMRLELHNLKVTTETYITALGQLREDNTHLTSELISIKASKFCIEEENEELRGHIRDIEHQEEKYREEINARNDSVSRLEQELVLAKLALAEAESEKEKLNKQLSGLRRLMLGSSAHQVLDKPTEISNETMTPKYTVVSTDQILSGTKKRLERQSSTRRSLDGWSWRLTGSTYSSPTTPTTSNFFTRSPAIPEVKEEAALSLEHNSFTSKLTGYFPRGRKAKRNSMIAPLTSSSPNISSCATSTLVSELPPQPPKGVGTLDQEKAKSLRRKEKCVSAIVVMNKDTGELEPWEFR